MPIMPTDLPARSGCSSRQVISSALPAGLAPEAATGVWLNGLREVFLITGGLVGVGLVALLDRMTGSRLSFSLFYLLPVAVCAWWGGLAHGLLLALAGAVAWHVVDLHENPALLTGSGVWNGVIRFCAFTLVSSLVSRVHAGMHRERRLARTDPLTGAANSRTFYEVARAEVERARRASRPLTLAYLDVDDFKLLNDRQGHAAGDNALRHIVRTIHLNLGNQGLLARLGGDEFALLLPEQDSQEASALLYRLQELLSTEMARGGWPVTLSVGAITFLRPVSDVHRMIPAVDVLMYKAKRKGKGRIEYAVVRYDQPRAGGERREVTRRAEDALSATAQFVCAVPS